MDVYIQLTVAGANTEPYDLYADLPAPAYSVAFATGVSAATLLAGATYTIPDYSTAVKVVSLGDCSVEKILSLTTTETTTEPLILYQIQQCPPSTDVYAARKDHVFSLGDIVEFTVGYPYPSGMIRCGEIIDENFIGSPDAVLYSAIMRECGDAVHCDVDSGITTTTTTTTTAIPINVVRELSVGSPNTHLDYRIQLSNVSGGLLNFRFSVSNDSRDSVFYDGPRHEIPDGTVNLTYVGTIPAFSFANQNGDTMSVRLSDDDGATWTVPITFDPPFTLPYSM